MALTQILVRNNNNLDLLRVVLATLVIVGHTNPINGASFGFLDPVNLVFPQEHIHTLAVKVFLFISGLVVTNSLLESRSGGTFLISRAFRILPNLFFLLLLTVLVVGPVMTSIPLAMYFTDSTTYQYLIKNAYFETRYALPGVFGANPYPGAVNGSLWTLAVEVPCYLILLSTYLVAVRFRKERLVLSLLALATILDTALNNHSFFAFLGDNPEVYMLPSLFAFGALLALHKDTLVIDWRTVLLMGTLSVIFRNSFIHHELLLLTICTAALYVFSRPLINRLKLPFDLSYGIYLWGFLIQQVTVVWLGQTPWWTHLAVSVALTVTIATVCHLAIEKPFMNLGKNLIRRLYPRP